MSNHFVTATLADVAQVTQVTYWVQLGSLESELIFDQDNAWLVPAYFRGIELTVNDNSSEAITQAISDLGLLADWEIISYYLPAKEEDFPF
jgi:hypothetical protein